MARSRLHLPGPLRPGETLSLPRDRAHYAAQVLRLRPGETLTLFDGSGGEYRAVIQSIERHTVSLQVTEYLPVERETPLCVTLALGVSRGERMDYAVQKATELGAHSIAPLITERCGVQLESKRALNRREHWRRVAVSACEQCGRNRLPQVRPVTDYKSWLGEQREGLGLVLCPEAVNHLADMNPAPGAPLTVLVGPEGGLSQQEVEQAVGAGFSTVRLGPRVLRTETAAVAALTAVQTRWGDLG